MWKDQILETEADCKTFIADHLSDITGYRLPPKVHQGGNRYTLSFTAPNQNELLSLSVSFVGKEMVWNNLHVSAACAGASLGSQIVKAGLGLAKERGCLSVLVWNPTLEGYAFWPTLGALPAESPERMAPCLNSALGLYGHLLDRQVRLDWEKIATAAEKDPLTGWRQLASHHLGKQPCLLRRETPYKMAKAFTFRNAARLGDLRIDLKDEETLAFMSRRLGALPKFKKSGSHVLYG